MRFFVTTLVVTSSLMLAPVANAQIIFDAIAGDAVTTVSNAMNPAPTLALNPPSATLSQTTGDSLSHFFSNDDIQTLNGGSIANTDTIKLTWEVKGMTNYTTPGNRNSIEFGLVSNAAFRGGGNPGTISRFRGDSGLVNANRVGHGFGNLFTNTGGQTENEATVEGGILGFDLEGTAASFEDGFTVMQTITAAGVTTMYSDIVVTDQAGNIQAGVTTLTTVLDPYLDPTFGNQGFAGFFNGAHFYAGAGFFDPAGGDVIFSTAQIEINPVPEPSSFALLALGGLLAVRRRRV